LTNLLNVIWPAIYVSQTFWKFWYLIIATIVIELVVLRLLLRFSWKKAFFASVIGNLVSGIAGTFVMMFGMLGWHAVADHFLQGTFSDVNWVMTYLLMCVGSVLIETKTVSLIYKVSLKKLFLPMLTGNLLTYIFIAFAMKASAKEAEIVKKERILFLSDTEQFTLLDSTVLSVDTAFIEIWYNRANERKDNAKPHFRLQVPFDKKNPDEYNVSFRLLDEGRSLGISDSKQQIFVDSIKDEFSVILEQKNPEPNVGWKVPLETDTFRLKRIKLKE
jgi:hypothetical protein